MNKLVTVFSALAVAAGIAHGEVKSANVVGYQWKDLNAEGYTFTCSSFLRIGDSGENMTVGDIIANDDFEAFSDSIQILDEDTVTQHWLTYVSQAWLDANDIGQEGYTVGWYKTTDEDLANPMNDISLPLGSAVMVYVGSAEAKLGYKGEVADEAKYVSVPVDGYGFIGNATPIALKIGELKPSSGFEPFTDSIQILDEETVTQHWLTYVSQAWLDANDIGQEGYTVGWYKTTDEDLANPMNDIVLNAGDAFMTYVSTEVNFEIPSAL